MNRAWRHTFPLTALFPGALPIGSQRVRAICPDPKHAETHPSCIVNYNSTHGWKWHCFACGADGDALDVLTGRDGMAFREAMAVLQDGYPQFVAGVSSGLVGNVRPARHGSRSGRWAGAKRRLVDSYDYTDERGQVLYQVQRYFPKDFRQRRRTSSGWTYTLGNVRRVPFMLAALGKAALGSMIFVCEGEADAIALQHRRLLATTNAGGCGGTAQWKAKDFVAPFKGHHVAVLPDNDDAGRKHAAAVAEALAGVAASVKVVNLPGLETKGDVSDWFGGGGTREDLIKLAAATPARQWCRGVSAGLQYAIGPKCLERIGAC